MFRHVACAFFCQHTNIITVQQFESDSRCRASDTLRQPNIERSLSSDTKPQRASAYYVHILFFIISISLKYIYIYYDIIILLCINICICYYVYILLYRGVTGNKASLRFLRQTPWPRPHIHQSSQQIYGRNSHLRLSVCLSADVSSSSERLSLSSRPDHLTFHPSHTWQKKRDRLQQDHVTRVVELSLVLKKSIYLK